MSSTSSTAYLPQAVAAHPQGHARALALPALGVVFGDIGTSPLYTLKVVLGAAGSHAAERAIVLGSLSLILWTLIIVTTIKYVGVAMRVDNHGEGGIMALMALLTGRKGLGSGRTKKKAFTVGVGLIGAALIYGDGVITPAISVLSALEGLSVITSRLADFVVPATVLILILLFFFQPQGTARIGNLFGPVMVLWFLVLGGLGLWGIVQNPMVIAAVNPLYGLKYLVSGGMTSFLVLGAVFLCVTGAEALYADMGHFGRGPIRLAWFGVVFPCLILNYAGQSALVLNGSPTENMFYALCPRVALVPFVILATVATIIASQAIITGAFSMTRQAIQLGWLPRLRVTQTSALGYGQIYISAVNWIMMVITIGLTIAFRKSDNLAAAYGIAVSGTMLMTSMLLYIAMVEKLDWSQPLSMAVAGCFILVDSAFMIANSAKMLDGGYIPLALAIVIYGVMWVWHSGRDAVMQVLKSRYQRTDTFLNDLAARGIPRVPGTAVFLTRSKEGVPPVMSWHVRHNRALHERIMIINVSIESVPFIHLTDRFRFFEEAPNFWRASVHYGFMERPAIPPILEEANAEGCDLDLSDVTYYVGRETVVSRPDGRGLPKWKRLLFAAMERNATQVTDFFRLPVDQVVEIGRQVAI